MLPSSLALKTTSCPVSFISLPVSFVKERTFGSDCLCPYLLASLPFLTEPIAMASLSFTVGKCSLTPDPGFGIRYEIWLSIPVE